jgi:hypothetical protein
MFSFNMRAVMREIQQTLDALENKGHQSVSLVMESDGSWILKTKNELGHTYTTEG